ncbi:MAG: RNA pyrophosphohydrolase [Litorimonas sp.]
MQTNSDSPNPQNYRPCVGTAIFNKDGLVWLGKRFGESGPYAWQMPQGGIDAGEKAEDAALRELFEETGITHNMVTPLGDIPDWLYYDFPAGYKAKRGYNWQGQRQRWFAFRFHGADEQINLKAHKEQEFSSWKWQPLADAPDLIVPFKRNVYDKVTTEFERFAVPDT